MADYISMKQVPGGTVTAKDDRIVYDANMADSGIIYGCGISYVGNNMIHINAGYGIIKGGMFEMEDHTEYVDLAENEPTTGQIYLHLDLSADDKLTIVKETTNSLHPMTQNADANFTNGVYELQLCTFTATTTALEDVTQTFEVIQNQVLDTLAEIRANTTAGLKAGALAVKALDENLTAISDALTEYSSTTATINYGSANTNAIQKCGNMLNIALNVQFSATSQANNLVTLPIGYRPLHDKYITLGVIRDGGAQANILCVVDTNGNIHSVSGSGNITQIFYGGTIPLN